MSTNRLASFQDFQNYVSKASTIASSDARGVAISKMLDGIGRRAANYILKSTVYPLYQYASDGINGPVENYGVEHYGKHKRNLIRLARYINPVSVTSVTDNDTVLSADEFYFDTRAAAIWRLNGMFYPAPGAVQVVYTSGYAETGAGDSLKLSCPDDLNVACLIQAEYEFNENQPGFAPVGVNTISRPDGSIVIQPKPWLVRVLDTLDDYRR